MDSFTERPNFSADFMKKVIRKEMEKELNLHCILPSVYMRPYARARARSVSLSLSLSFSFFLSRSLFLSVSLSLCISLSLSLYLLTTQNMS